MEKDMTVGNPIRIIINFAFPIFIGNVFMQLYNMVDTIIVGKFVGAKALAAVGSTGTIMFFIFGFLSGLTQGFAVPVSQKFGAGDMDSMRKAAGTAMILSVIVSAAITIVSMSGMKWMLRFMNTPEDIFTDAYSYIMVVCAGIAAQVLYNLLSGILRALGNSKIPLYFLVFASFLNIFLDLLFIVILRMGVTGAAYATIMSEGVSGVLCLIYIIKKVPILHLSKDDWKPSRSSVKTQLGIGIPMGFQFSIVAIGAMIMQSSLNMFGALAIAGVTTANKIEGIVSQAYGALGTAMATYCAQNIGTGKIDRIRKGFRTTGTIVVIYSIISGALVIMFGKYLVPLFVSENVSEIMVYVDTYLKCAGTFLVSLGLVGIYRNGIQGMGYGMLPMMAGIAELVGRGSMAAIAAKYESYLGVCMAGPTAWTLATILILIVYFYIMKKTEKQEFYVPADNL